MADRPQVRVFVAAKARAKDAEGEWQEYEGPRGGEGAINVQTGEVRYDVDPDDIGQDTETDEEIDEEINWSNPSNWVDPEDVNVSFRKVKWSIVAAFGEKTYENALDIGGDMAFDNNHGDIEPRHLIEALYEVYDPYIYTEWDMQFFQEEIAPKGRELPVSSSERTEESNIPEKMNPESRDNMVSLTEYIGSGGMSEHAMSVAYNDGPDGPSPLFITHTDPDRVYIEGGSKRAYASDYNAKLATTAAHIINNVISNHWAPQHHHEEGEFLSVEGIEGFPLKDWVVEQNPGEYGAAMGVQFLLFNEDPHYGNMFYTGEGGDDEGEYSDFVCIDLDLAFNAKPDRRVEIGELLPDGDIERRVSLLSDRLVKALRFIDNPDTVDAVIDGFVESAEAHAPEIRAYIERSSRVEGTSIEPLPDEIRVLSEQATIAESGKLGTYLRALIEEEREEGRIVS